MTNNIDFFFGITPGNYIYDIETYPNMFCIGIEQYETGHKWYFEISTDKNHIQSLVQFLSIMSNNDCRMVGFNNIGFDYPVIHFIYKNANIGITCEDIYKKANSIINSHGPAKFTHMVWESEHIVPQIDLFKIHHFDNIAKSTSLKMLEFNMRMDNIEDLPFTPGTELRPDQREILADYMWHDIKATRLFYEKSLKEIEFREKLGKQYGKSFINYSDTKIGSEIFIEKLEYENPGCCYDYSSGKRKIVQTPRDKIIVKDILPDYIQFEHPEFKRIHNWFKDQVITETKGVFKDIHCVIDGLRYDFGTGGIHGALNPCIVHSDKRMIIESRDVTSYYPNLAIQNGLYPEHLGQTFCTLYDQVYQERKKHKKGTPENKALKLSLNSNYGNSNNKYSPFYDPQFTMSITLSGQLSLCMLVENLIKIPTLRILMINTDGVEYIVDKQHQNYTDQVCSWWESITKLELEKVEYSRLFIRDCNNYIAEHTDGKLKRKGAYEYKLSWHQNHSSLVVPKAVEATLVHGEDVTRSIIRHDDIFDFFLRVKIPRNSQLKWGDKIIQNTSRYYISKNGHPLNKIMPAAGPVGQYKRANSLTDEYYNGVMAEIGLDKWDERIHTKNKSKYEVRKIGIHTGWTVDICNKLPPVISDPDYINKNGNDGGDIYEYEQFRNNINYAWYIKEAKKLIEPLMG